MKARGMTLNELLVAMAISTVVLVSIFSIYFLGIRLFIDGRKDFELQHAMRNAFEIITKEVLWSKDLRAIPSDYTYSSADNGYEFITISGNTIERFLYEGNQKTKISNLTEANIGNLEFNIASTEPVLTMNIQSIKDGIRLQSSVRFFNQRDPGSPPAGNGIRYK